MFTLKININFKNRYAKTNSKNNLYTYNMSFSIAIVF